MNKTTAIVVFVLVLVGALIIWKLPVPSNGGDVPSDTATTTATSTATSTPQNPAPQDPNQPQQPVAYESKTQLGLSIDGNDITAYHFGTGEKEILFVGGIHGGYSWNTAKVAYEAIEYFKANKNAVPSNIRVTIVPVLNPDGLVDAAGTYKDFEASDVTASQGIKVASRFNSHNVDLNRNFGCDWQGEAVWQNTKVSGGQSVFSEPETQAIRSYIETAQPDGVVIWYSAAGGVYASSCHTDILPETTAMADAYGKAAGYGVHKEYDFYATTGDMANWLASEEIPAISVLLSNHTSTEWTKNRAGIEAVIKYYAGR